MITVVITVVITVLLVAAGIVWTLVALAVAVMIGMGIGDADRREAKSCCPHPPSEAPPTVRGEFRAVVVPTAARRGSRLDVKL